MAARQPALNELMRAWLRVSGSAGLAVLRAAAAREQAAAGCGREGAAAWRAGGGREVAAAEAGRGWWGSAAAGWRLAAASLGPLAAP
eukprot:2843132-Prymnesium_polylepis.1